MSRRLPALKPREVMRALERAGFLLRRVTGSHHRYVHPGDPRRWTIVPFHNRDLRTGTLREIIKQAGLTEEEFLDLL
jgi:predicted RNA binding protein YcfA (HicA-like mRNA interferase family)